MKTLIIIVGETLKQCETLCTVATGAPCTLAHLIEHGLGPCEIQARVETLREGTYVTMSPIVVRSLQLLDAKGLAIVSFVTDNDTVKVLDNGLLSAPIPMLAIESRLMADILFTYHPHVHHVRD